MRNRELPSQQGRPMSERVKEDRKKRHKRYTQSAIGKERRRFRDLKKRVEYQLTSDYLKANPEVEEAYMKKYFSKRIDGLGNNGD